MQVSWAALKSFVTSRSLSIQWIDDSGFYYLVAIDGNLQLECSLNKANTNEELAEFEATYKAAGNIRLAQYDTDGANIVRLKAAKAGWTFCSLPVEFQTARLSADMFSETSTGAARSFITLKAYDNADAEVTTPGLANINYASIVKTVIDFEPPYDYEIIGGDLRTLTTIGVDMRLWLIAAPDIAAPYGTKEMGGGINLKYLSPGNVWSVDGRVAKFATYSASLHTNKIRLIFKYPAGTNESLQVIFQIYKQ